MPLPLPIMCCIVDVDRWVVVGVMGGAWGAGVRGVASLLRMRAATSSLSVDPSSTPVPSQRWHGNLEHEWHIVWCHWLPCLSDLAVWCPWKGPSGKTTSVVKGQCVCRDFFHGHYLSIFSVCKNSKLVKILIQLRSIVIVIATKKSYKLSVYLFVCRVSYSESESISIKFYTYKL